MPTGPRDCWFSELSGDAAGRPKTPIRPGQIEIRQDANHSRKRSWCFYQLDDQSTAVETTLARVMAMLTLGLPIPRTLQASHLCYNERQRCFNPAHVCWEDDRMNKSRTKCTSSSRFYCNHEPRCVYTDSAGRYLVHRNLDKYVECDCPVDCHAVEISPLPPPRSPPGMMPRP